MQMVAVITRYRYAVQAKACKIIMLIPEISAVTALHKYMTKSQSNVTVLPSKNWQYYLLKIVFIHLHSIICKHRITDGQETAAEYFHYTSVYKIAT